MFRGYKTKGLVITCYKLGPQNYEIRGWLKPGMNIYHIAWIRDPKQINLLHILTMVPKEHLILVGKDWASIMTDVGVRRPQCWGCMKILHRRFFSEFATCHFLTAGSKQSAPKLIAVQKIEQANMIEVTNSPMYTCIYIYIILYIYIYLLCTYYIVYMYIDLYWCMQLICVYCQYWSISIPSELVKRPICHKDHWIDQKNELFLYTLQSS